MSRLKDIKAMQADLKERQTAKAEIYALITEYGIDQVCECSDIAKREAKELRSMGCTVKIKAFDSWDAYNQFETKLES
jgi:hypothetical protein